jgi:tetrapyrrole methylase family protein/MazG family protein
MRFLLHHSISAKHPTPALIVVGSGIKFLSHLTIEAKAHIEQSDKVLYLVNEPAMKEWLQKANANTESLDDLYFQYDLRAESYRAITDHILSALLESQHVCVVLYGHPAVFAKPALDAVQIAKKRGYHAAVLPGISAEDCLFADLLVDPGSHGCLSLEATDLLLRQKKIDPTCHVVIWQIAVIGLFHHSASHDNSTGIKLLVTYLHQFYDMNQEVTLYVAAQYPGFEAFIQHLTLEQLINTTIPRIATLYIAPAEKSPIDKTTLQLLV